MTVTYSDKSFIKLLPRWRGSVWKAIGKNYLIWLVCYFIISFTYRFGLNEPQQKEFDEMVNTFNKWQGSIPLTFLIGFYVSTIFSRWWEQQGYVVWPDKVMWLIVGNIRGTDTESRMIRRAFARYCNLLSVMCWRSICVKIKKRFPTEDHLRRAGLMNEKEFEIFQNTNKKFGRWFIPVGWMFNLLRKCRDENRISDYAHQEIMREIFALRAKHGKLGMYDWIDVPLVYTQVVTVGTYGYFILGLISRQALIQSDPSYDTDIYFPIFATLEFIFYIGWLKVGEELRCPFGEDDDDFDMNYILDRNMHVSHMIVEELHDQKVPLEKDIWFDGEYPSLPHTKASYLVRDRPPANRIDKYKMIPDEFDYHDSGNEEKSKKWRNAKVADSGNGKAPANGNGKANGNGIAHEMDDLELKDHIVNV